MPGYSQRHARSGLKAKFPPIECWPSQFRGTDITIVIPEYTAICPKTGLPDFGTVTIQYEPRKLCLELKSLKMYVLAYRQVGIFYENAVNRILRDVIKAVQPVWCVVKGEFSSRGGIHAVVEASYPKSHRRVS
jgi:7-cyano-7-deazaguanine reductase